MAFNPSIIMGEFDANPDSPRAPPPPSPSPSSPDPLLRSRHVSSLQLM